VARTAPKSLDETTFVDGANLIQQDNGVDGQPTLWRFDENVFLNFGAQRRVERDFSLRCAA
jgi:hypothetical protein